MSALRALPAVLLFACGGRDFTQYEGVGTAELVVVGRPADLRRRSEPDEQARARTGSDGRIEVQLDECSFTTERAIGGSAIITPGTKCGADDPAATAEITVQTGEVTLDEASGTLSVRLEGQGRVERLGEHLDVRYRYSFTGSRR